MTNEIERGHPVYVAGIIEEHDGKVLICRPQDEKERRNWEFPGGPARVGESPEAALRRLTVERTGVAIEIHVGQPPLLIDTGGRKVAYRFFLCGRRSGDAQAVDYAEVRWIAKGQLCEYDFDPPTSEVAAWVAE